MLDPWQVLGVERGAQPEALQRAFKRAVRKHHPDLNPNDPAAAERLRLIVAAYQHLIGAKDKKATQPRTPSIIAISCQLRGADLYGELRLQLALLPPDRWLEVQLDALDTCVGCNGVGWEQVAGSWGRTERWECEACRGAGLLRVHRRGRVRVPLKVVEGTRVRLRGVGLARPGLTRGDAILSVVLSAPAAKERPGRP